MLQYFTKKNTVVQNKSIDDVEYYENGRIKKKETYINNILSGVVCIFYDNEKNTLCEIYNYVNGIKQGPYMKYYENGMPKYSCIFINDVLNGTSVRFFPTGSVECLCTHKNGKYEGDFFFYNISGNVIKHSFYADGVLIYSKKK